MGLPPAPTPGLGLRAGEPPPVRALTSPHFLLFLIGLPSRKLPKMFISLFFSTLYSILVEPSAEACFFKTIRITLMRFPLNESVYRAWDICPGVCQERWRSLLETGCALEKGADGVGEILPAVSPAPPSHGLWLGGHDPHGGAGTMNVCPWPPPHPYHKSGKEGCTAYQCSLVKQFTIKTRCQSCSKHVTENLHPRESENCHF